MKASTVIAVAALAYSASAQLENIPQCALSCAIGSLANTGCPTTDIACICRATGFITSLVPCVQGACSEAEFGATAAAAQGLCADAGVTLEIPTGGASSSAAPSTTEAPSSTTETVTETSVTSTVETVEPSTNATTTATDDSTPTGNATNTDVTPPEPTGDDGSSASRNAVAIGGLGALVAFVAALL